jgi:hypothetical protein
MDEQSSSKAAIEAARFDDQVRPARHAASWDSGQVGFFDAAVAAIDARAAAQRAERGAVLPPPDWNDILASVALERLIWSGEHAAAAMSDVVANRTGFGFTIHLRWTGEEPHVQNPVRHRGDTGIAVGLILADGRQVSADRFAHGEDGPQLYSRGGSTSGGGPYNHAEAGYWSTPLPPPGSLTLVFEWSQQGVAPVHVMLDAEAIRGAAARSLRFWTEES